MGSVPLESITDSTSDAARWWEACQLTASDQIGELRARVVAGDADALAGQCRIDDLRQILCTADGRVRPELAAWLCRQGNIEVVEVAADAGDDDCQRKLAAWRARQGGASGAG